MSVVLTSNAKEYEKRFDELAEKARYLLSSQILGDSNRYVRADSWELMRSSKRSSVPSKGELIWDTPYAKRVYYTGKPSHDENPYAELMWVHVARERHGKDWIMLFENLARKEILND